MAFSWHKVAAELGLPTILHAPLDLHIIFMTRFLRMLAYGGVSLILALFFAALDVSDARIGLFMTLTLLGDVLLSLLLTLVADTLGRRRVLLLGCGCMALAGAVFALASSYWFLLIAAIVGVISVSGNEIGPFRAVEESALAGLVGDTSGARSDVFAWYVVVGTLGSAVGLTGSGWVVEACKKREGWEELDAFRVVFWCYGAVGLVKAVLTMLLSVRCEVGYVAATGGSRGAYTAVSSSSGGGNKDTAAEEADESERDEFLVTPSRSSGSSDGHGHARDDETNERPLPPTPPQPAPPPKPKIGFAQLSNSTRWMMLKLCALFAVDSLASGMVPYSLINFYLDRKFHMPKSTLGSIMATTWVTSSIGNIFATVIAKRIGLIKTMVFTHLPSAFFLALIPAPRAIWLTAVLLVARGTLASMDQAPRSAFLALVVKPEERTAVMGIVNVVKTLSQSGGPSVTGLLAGGNRFWIAFVVAGAMKASYDCGLMSLFVKVEREAEGAIKLGQQESRELADEFELDTDDEGFDSDDGRPGKRRDSAA
ncbi:putative major facilitator superfamily transporter protein [Lasiodiplodia theobromae]|uniref:Major facilitator superfamily transporter protein n=1 Tax=Lasiodiplodia theobromae TaxID=45133 RepID=A0A8H7MB49_9PEZI|nr:putative major facilitator superfamily transporter protein [Lasiodiplodia theobromae]